MSMKLELIEYMDQFYENHPDLKNLAKIKTGKKDLYILLKKDGNNAVHTGDEFKSDTLLLKKYFQQLLYYSTVISSNKGIDSKLKQFINSNPYSVIFNTKTILNKEGSLKEQIEQYIEKYKAFFTEEFDEDRAKSIANFLNENKEYLTDYNRISLFTVDSSKEDTLKEYERLYNIYMDIRLPNSDGQKYGKYEDNTFGKGYSKKKIALSSTGKDYVDKDYLIKCHNLNNFIKFISSYLPAKNIGDNKIIYLDPEELEITNDPDDIIDGIEFRFIEGKQGIDITGYKYFQSDIDDLFHVKSLQMFGKMNIKYDYLSYIGAENVYNEDLIKRRNNTFGKNIKKKVYKSHYELKRDLEIFLSIEDKFGGGVDVDIEESIYKDNIEISSDKDFSFLLGNVFYYILRKKKTDKEHTLRTFNQIARRINTNNYKNELRKLLDKYAYDINFEHDTFREAFNIVIQNEEFKVDSIYVYLGWVNNSSIYKKNVEVK